ncbi:hypothetical protein N2152v2_003099 [Parachlorella kessleri]
MITLDHLILTRRQVGVLVVRFVAAASLALVNYVFIAKLSFLVLQLVNAAFYLAPNAYYLAKRECSWFLLPINVFGFMRWSCWAALFFLMVAQAHSLLPAHIILEHTIIKPFIWAFAKRWPPPPPAEGLMGHDLPVAWREQGSDVAKEVAVAMKAASAKRLLAGVAHRGVAGAAAAAAVAPVRAAVALAAATARAAAAAVEGNEEAGEQGLVPHNQMEPMFCFETALKALYLSNLVYYYLEGDGIVVVGFRGTASLANVLADLKGFLDAYKAGGLNEKLLRRLGEIIGAESHPSTTWSGGGGDSGIAALQGQPSGTGNIHAGRGCSGQQRWRVLCTGHSLGGALATLFSYDAANEAQRLRQKGFDVQVQMYTFGSPRPGNHAFARDFLRAVPDSWDCIHSNDAIAKGGDILPRPSVLESSLHRGPGSSIRLHLLGAYHRSFAAVIRGQFQSKAQGEASRDALRMLVGQRFVREMLGSLLSTRPQPLLSRLRDRSGSRAPSIYQLIELSTSPPSPQAIPDESGTAAAEGGFVATGINASETSSSVPASSQEEQHQPPPMHFTRLHPNQQQQHQTSWEAVGQVGAAQLAEQQQLGGEGAADVEEGGPALEGVADVHVGSGQRLERRSCHLPAGSRWMLSRQQARELRFFTSLTGRRRESSSGTAV